MLLIYIAAFLFTANYFKNIFDTRLNFVTHIITITIIGFAVPNSFEFIYLQLLAGIVSILSVCRCIKEHNYLFQLLKL